MLFPFLPTGGPDRLRLEVPRPEVRGKGQPSNHQTERNRGPRLPQGHALLDTCSIKGPGGWEGEWGEGGRQGSEEWK